MNGPLPWGEIRAYYERINGPVALAMLPLVKEIESSRYASGLFGYPGHGLRIKQVPAANANDGPYLLITPLVDGSVELRYIDTFVEAEQWRRTVEAAQAFRRLERFIDDLRWFTREAQRGGA